MNKIEANCATMTQDEVKDQGVVDCQTEALTSSQTLATEKREHAETMVHFAALFKKYDDFKECIKNSFNFDNKELQKFLHKHNMTTEKLFKRNVNNGPVLRANRGKAREAMKQTKLR